MKAGDIISYRAMCDAEGINTLQRGMNYRLCQKHSVVLMSRRPGAPYRDRVSDDGTVIWYEGHDIPKQHDAPPPKSVDQPLRTATGAKTQNGKFWDAAKERGDTPSAEVVRVYEKLKPGIWAYNGEFLLREAVMERDEQRAVVVFRLEIVEGQQHLGVQDVPLSHTRVIPSEVKLQVWKRDQGRCVQCGATDNLHFDHVLPFSKGGTSLMAENVQLLCARHNLQKSDQLV